MSVPAMKMDEAADLRGFALTSDANLSQFGHNGIEPVSRAASYSTEPDRVKIAAMANKRIEPPAAGLPLALVRVEARGKPPLTVRSPSISGGIPARHSEYAEGVSPEGVLQGKTSRGSVGYFGAANA